jgi:membrane protease subunit HflK
MQQILDRYKLGALVTNVTMQNVQPPEQVQSAFDDAVKAGQDRARARNEGEAYANDVIPRPAAPPSACCRKPKPTARWWSKRDR